jgi:hypothetical protein
MTDHAFDPECEHCRPALVDPVTGKALPDTDPGVVSLLEAWRAAPRAEQEAFHKVTSHNSRDPKELAAAASLSKRIHESWKARTS